MQRACDLAERAFTLAQRVDGETHQVAEGLHQAMTQVTGQIQINGQTTQSVAAKLGLVEREILDRSEISSPVIPNVEVHIHNSSPSLAGHNKSVAGGRQLEPAVEGDDIWATATLDPLDVGPVYQPSPSFYQV